MAVCSNGDSERSSTVAASAPLGLGQGLARHLRVDPETALRRANQRFEDRFRRMEAVASRRGLRLEGLDPAAWDTLWEEAKRSVQS